LGIIRLDSDPKLYTITDYIKDHSHRVSLVCALPLGGSDEAPSRRPLLP